MGVPLQNLLAPPVQLLSAHPGYEVVLLEWILGQIVELLGLVAEVVDVLLLTLDPRCAQQVGPAAEEQRAIFGQLEHGAAGVLAVDYLVAEHIHYGWREVHQVRRPFEALSAAEALRVVDDQRDPQALLPDHAVVMIDAVLA